MQKMPQKYLTITWLVRKCRDIDDDAGGVVRKLLQRCFTSLSRRGFTAFFLHSRMINELKRYFHLLLNFSSSIGIP